MTRILLFVLLCVVAAFVWRDRMTEPAPAQAATRSAPSAAAPGSTGAKLLALGAASSAGTVSIPLQGPVELDFLSKAEVLALRSTAVAAHPQLLAGKYSPSEAVFGQIVDGAPWWGIEGQFVRGPGMMSIIGPAEESRFILNPYLLVAAEFNDWWQDRVEAAKNKIPLTCQPTDLRWSPREHYAEVSYDADCIRTRQRPQFDLIAYNARDIGLGHMYVSYADSTNVSKTPAPTNAYDNPQFIHKGGSCGYAGGCNNMSPQTPPLDGIQLDALPAKTVILLWHSKPASPTQRPDMTFAIHFR